MYVLVSEHISVCACVRVCMTLHVLVMCDIDDMNIYRDINACDMI